MGIIDFIRNKRTHNKQSEDSFQHIQIEDKNTEQIKQRKIIVKKHTEKCKINSNDYPNIFDVEESIVITPYQKGCTIDITYDYYTNQNN